MHILTEQQIHFSFLMCLHNLFVKRKQGQFHFFLKTLNFLYLQKHEIKRYTGKEIHKCMKNLKKVCQYNIQG